VIFPQGIVVHQSHTFPEKAASVATIKTEIKPSNLGQDNDAVIEAEELSSDAQEIRKQARQAPTPETGQNIL
jgi:hypothetical protein